jgi:hypothetical protein
VEDQTHTHYRWWLEHKPGNDLHRSALHRAGADRPGHV